ncbi:MAG: hypothetical protein M1832_005080 [Thelocarpon impressellum]|nr:MAG: hypothetical protein M1832_005080 [Thelocarpon impressellum]
MPPTTRYRVSSTGDAPDDTPCNCCLRVDPDEADPRTSSPRSPTPGPSRGPAYAIPGFNSAEGSSRLKRPRRQSSVGSDQGRRKTRQTASAETATVNADPSDAEFSEDAEDRGTVIGIVHNGGEVDEAEANGVDLATELAEIKSRLADTRSQLETTKDYLDDAREDYRTTRQALDDARSVHASTKKSLEDEREASTIMRRSLDHAKEINEHYARERKIIGDIQEQVKELESSCRRKQGRVDDAKAKLDESQLELKSFRKAGRELKRNLEDRLSSCEKELDTFRPQVEKLGADLACSNRLLFESQRDKKAVETKLRETKAKLNAARVQTADAKLQFDTVRRSSSEKERLLVQIKSGLDALYAPGPSGTHGLE